MYTKGNFLSFCSQLNARNKLQQLKSSQVSGIVFFYFTVTDAIRALLVSQKDGGLKYCFDGNLNSNFHFLRHFTLPFPRQSILLWTRDTILVMIWKTGDYCNNIHAQSPALTTEFGVQVPRPIIYYTICRALLVKLSYTCKLQRKFNISFE